LQRIGRFNRQRSDDHTRHAQLEHACNIFDAPEPAAKLDWDFDGGDDRFQRLPIWRITFCESTV
jgi:hypothetical protein